MIIHVDLCGQRKKGIKDVERKITRPVCKYHNGSTLYLDFGYDKEHKKHRILSLDNLIYFYSHKHHLFYPDDPTPLLEIRYGLLYRTG